MPPARRKQQTHLFDVAGWHKPYRSLVFEPVLFDLDLPPPESRISRSVANSRTKGRHSLFVDTFDEEQDLVFLDRYFVIRLRNIVV